MRNKRTTHGMAALVIMLLSAWLTAGCALSSNRHIDPNALVGTWTGAGGASMSFAANGTLTFSNFPLQKDDPDAFTDPQTGSGTWKIAPPTSTVAEHLEVVYATTVPFFGQLFPRWSGDKMRLYFELGGPVPGLDFWLKPVPGH